MLAFFERIVKYSRFQSDLEQYISERHPKSAADVERLIKEYTYGSIRICLWSVNLSNLSLNIDKDKLNSILSY